MRRPDAELLRQMLDEPDLEARLQGLKERYGFIWVEQLRLDEKLTQFLRAYLLADLRRTSQRVQTLNDRAIAWLELQVKRKPRALPTPPRNWRKTTLAETLLDLAHHQFWRSEEAGMRYLVPRFIEGWQYDRDWTRSLLEIAESFQGCLGKGYRQRLSQFEAVLDTVFYPDPDAWQAALTDLGKLKQRDWLAGDNPAELQTILAMRQGQLAYRLEKYHSALRMYLASEQTLPPVASRLRQDLAANFYRVSNEFIWPDKDTSLVFSLEGEQAAEKAVALDPNRSEHQYNLGVIRSNGGRLYEAISAYQQAIKLECKSAHPHNGLGNVYAQQGRYDEAITAYQEAISLDQRDAAPHNGLGNVYRAQGRYDEAISAYQQAIKLEHKLADPYNGLGSVYRNQGHYDEAITTYRQAIKLDPKYAVPNANLGEVHLLKSCFSEAERLFLKALKMKGEDYYELFYLGLAQALQGKPNAALENWQKSLSLATDTSPPARLNRCLIQLALASSPTAIEQFAATIQHYQSSQGLLKEALETAQLLARCPQPPAKIDQAIALLQAALEPPSS
jgi:tetratricopeptide (TPR) repeat protein